MNQSQRRANTLTNEQISYINGCAKLQLAIWRLTHRDPLMALSDRMSKYLLRQAINILMDTRQIKKTKFKSIYTKMVKKFSNYVYV